MTTEAYWHNLSGFHEYVKDCQNPKAAWDWISANRRLPESFMEENATNLNWYFICTYQDLTEPFIERNSNRINWHCISFHQQLSEDFIEKHRGEVDWRLIFANKRIKLTRF